MISCGEGYLLGVTIEKNWSEKCTHFLPKVQKPRKNDPLFSIPPPLPQSEYANMTRFKSFISSFAYF